MLSSREFEKVAPAAIRRRFKIILKTVYKRVTQLAEPEFHGGALSLAEGKLWLFAMSKNNLDALHFIYNAIDDSVFVLDKRRKEFSSYRSIVPALRFQILNLYQFPILLIALVRRDGHYARRLSPVILRSIGFYEEWIRILRKTRPKAIVFANDHNMESRSLLLAALALKIPTVYLQHATVSTSFPPLKFDLCLLEGQDAAEKYGRIGEIKGRVELVGMPKFDPYLERRKAAITIKHIGIPYNLNDNLIKLEELLTKLHEAFPEGVITIRKHPKDKTDFSFASKFPYLRESDPLKETAFDFLTEQDCIIAGNSSIHLEATLLNRLSIYFNFDQGTFIDDYYGYVKNGLVSSASDVGHVISLIKEKRTSDENRFLKARYYNSTVGTIWEGKSEQLVLETILNFVNSHAAAH